MLNYALFVNVNPFLAVFNFTYTYRSGLADRMKKLINREKSSVAFWNHQLTDTKKQPQGKHISRFL